jgi:hypothetical protein
MKFQLYRFSPISTHEKLLHVIEYIHFECYKLCKRSFDSYLPNAGNIGVFCHYDPEYSYLTELRKQLTVESENVDQKYFLLHEPIVIPAKDDIPQTTYEYLYIRKPDPYRFHVGDVDFYLPLDQYATLKQEMFNGKSVKGARVFDRPDLDMIELYDYDSDVLAYISTEMMTKAVRVKLSEHTNL